MKAMVKGRDLLLCEQGIREKESREEKQRGFCVDLVLLPNGWMVVLQRTMSEEKEQREINEDRREKG